MKRLKGREAFDEPIAGPHGVADMFYSCVECELRKACVGTALNRINPDCLLSASCWLESSSNSML